MAYGWLTPEALPTGFRHVDITVPQGGTWENLFLGALAPLFDSCNFEQSGALTPEETAAAFRVYMTNWIYLWDLTMEGMHVAGEVFWFAGQSAPGSALVCDGTIYNAADYPALFAAIGGLWGGNGTTNFAVPALGGRVLVGAGAGAGLTPRAPADQGGEETHALTVAEMPKHAHKFKPGDNTAATGTDRSFARVLAPWTIDTDTAGGDAAHENMPPWAALLPCIQAF